MEPSVAPSRESREGRPIVAGSRASGASAPDRQTATLALDTIHSVMSIARLEKTMDFVPLVRGTRKNASNAPMRTTRRSTSGTR